MHIRHNVGFMLAIWKLAYSSVPMLHTATSI